MPVAVPIIAGTAIRGVAATLMMRGVLERHPNAFLLTLANFGVTLPLHRSQEHLARDIRRGLLDQGRDPGCPIVLVGHSQGALAALRYTMDHPDQVEHVFSVGAPWNGARSATNVNRLVGRRLVPAISDMAKGSAFLERLHADVAPIADRITNIYATHEIFIRPYIDAHVDVPGVTNILMATMAEYRRHLDHYPDRPVDDLIIARTNHLGEMSSPELRGLIWAKVEEISRHLTQR